VIDMMFIFKKLDGQPLASRMVSKPARHAAEQFLLNVFSQLNAQRKDRDTYLAAPSGRFSRRSFQTKMETDMRPSSALW
jgi:hypothetical protein